MLSPSRREIASHDRRNRSISHPERRAVDAGAHVTAIGWLKGTAAFGLGDGGVLLAKDGETHRVEAHPDAGVLVGGERRRALRHRRRRRPRGRDGRRTARPRPSPRPRAPGSTRSPSARAAPSPMATGKRVTARDDKGREKTLEVPSDRPRPRLRAEGLPARDLPLQRRDPLVSQRRRPSPNSSNGRARISTSPGRRTRASSSPRCRRTRCTAGGSCPTRATCA